MSSAGTYLVFDRDLWPVLQPLLSGEARLSILWVGGNPGAWQEPAPLTRSYELRDQDRAVAVLEPDAAAVRAACDVLIDGRPGCLIVVGGGAQGLAFLDVWRRRTR